ncbi:MAG: Wzz/FepE/Etk N-terminal domain-containing protein [Gammaproteobacteria bacterium]|nr:Wzz/FepE/Etk N-terminal domain-containing protein [Gammaproteobacteria bacterium]
MKSAENSGNEWHNSRLYLQDSRSFASIEDEISLYELFNAALKRKKIILGTVLFFFIVSLALALMREERYLYTTGIELGSIDGEATTRIGSPETVKEKLQVAYIPQTIAEYRAEYPDDEYNYIIDVAFGKGSKLIALSSKGKESLGETYLELHQRAVDKLIADHKDKLDVPRNRIRTEYEQARIALEKLKEELIIGVEEKRLQKSKLDAAFALKEFEDTSLFQVQEIKLLNEKSRKESALQQQVNESKFYVSQIDRLMEDKKLLQREIEDLRVHLQSAVQREQQAIQNVSNEQSAMLLMLLSKEIQDYRDRLMSLEQQLTVTLEDKIEATQLKHQQSLEAQKIQQKEVSEVQAQLDKLSIVRNEKIKSFTHQVNLIDAELAQKKLNLQQHIQEAEEHFRLLGHRLEGIQDTRSVAPPLKSDQPAGLGKSLIVALGLAAGAAISLMLVLILEGYEQSKRKSLLGHKHRGESVPTTQPNAAGLAQGNAGLVELAEEMDLLAQQKKAS